MRQPRVPAVFMRGGTSNAVVFDRRHLPDDVAVRERLFIAALGSPDPYGRQLDGMGGGISSLSKVCIVGPPSRPDADVDYTFGPGRRGPSPDRLEQQLREHVVGHRTFRGGRGDGRNART